MLQTPELRKICFTFAKEVLPQREPFSQARPKKQVEDWIWKRVAELLNQNIYSRLEELRFRYGKSSISPNTLKQCKRGLSDTVSNIIVFEEVWSVTF
jgi:hypothetical protein